MKSFFGLGLLVIAAGVQTGVCASQPTVAILRKGRSAFVRWPYRPGLDIVSHITAPANEVGYFLPTNVPTGETSRKGHPFHWGGDDFPACALKTYGHLGGNHGSFFGHVQTVPDHGFDETAIGTEVRHSSGETFRIVDVLDKDRLLLHPDGCPGGDPKLQFYGKGTFSCGAKTWTDPETTRIQLYPMNRYRCHRWSLPNGEEVPTGVETNVPYAELTIVHDVVDPRALMRHLKEHPGRRMRPEISGTNKPLYLDTPAREAEFADFAALGSLMTVRATYRIQPYGARVVTRETTFNAEIEGVDSLEVMYAWSPSSPDWKDLVFYAPRCKPKRMSLGDAKGELTVDLTAAKPFDAGWSVSGSLRKEDCTDPENMPDRFVRIGGPSGRRLGIVLGYSLIDGITALENKSRERNTAYFFWPGGKMYPRAYQLKDVKPGRTVRCVAYKQYFNPDDEPDATAFHHHREGDCHVVYFDTHRRLDGKVLKLPPEMAGLAISVLEKTPSVTLRTKGVVPASGEVVLDVAGEYGTLVLKLGKRGDGIPRKHALANECK